MKDKINKYKAVNELQVNLPKDVKHKSFHKMD